MCVRVSKLLILLASTTLAACGGGGGKNDDPDPGNTAITVSIGNGAALEGDGGNADMSFTVSLSATSTTDVSVRYDSADGSADQADYVPVSDELTIPAGATSATIIVSIVGDQTIEADEDFTIGLTNPVNATIGNAIGTGQITNDDFPLIRIGSATIAEGDGATTTLTFDVSLDQAGIGDITVDYATSDVAAESASDYNAASGTLTIAEGDTTSGIDVAVVGDIDIETDEQFLINLFNASANARIDVDEAFGQITNDDFPTVSIDPGSVIEIDSGTRSLTMPVTLNAAATADLIVSFETTDVTATAGDDYVADTGTITISAGDIAGSVAIETIGDTEIENTETFEVALTGLQGPGVLDRITAIATIVDNDGGQTGPQLVGSNAGVAEGNSGTSLVTFIISLDQISTDDVNFDYATADSTATAGEDYVATSGTALIPAGQSNVAVTVTVNGDADEESDESFLLVLSNPSPGVTIFSPMLSGSIVDDDTQNQPPPQLRISPAAGMEGDTGTTDLIFAVSLNEPSATVVSVDYFSEEGSATEGVDYQGVSGMISFQIGDTQEQIVVVINGDTFSEDDESFRIRLNNLTGDAVLAGSSALGTIITDEPLTRLTISDHGSAEGDSGTTDFGFVVGLDVASVEPVSFDYATSDGTALAGEDYITANGSLQIPAGNLSETIIVTVNGDTDNEPDESFSLELTNFSLNTVVLDAEALGSITNDDGTPGWQTPTTLGAGFDPDVAMDTGGNAAAIYVTPTNLVTFENTVAIHLLENGTWQSPTEFLSFSRSLLRQPQIAALGGGSFIAAYLSDLVVFESATYTPGTGWAEAEIAPLNGFRPSLDSNESGEAVFTFESSGNNFDPTDIWRNYFNGMWEAPELAELDDTDNARAPFIAIDDAGNRMVYWRQNFSDVSLSGGYYDYYDATSMQWTGPTLFPETQFASNEALSMLNDGRAALAVQQRGFGNNPNTVELLIYQPGSGWVTEPAQTATNDGATLPEFAVDSAGNIFVAWFQSPSSGFYDVYVNRYDAALGQWDVSVQLENGSGTAIPTDGGLDLAVDNSGNAIVAWSQDIAPQAGNDFRIRATRYSSADNEWSPPEQIDDGAVVEAAVGPEIAMDAAGNAVVVWLYDGVFEIGTARFIAP